MYVMVTAQQKLFLGMLVHKKNSTKRFTAEFTEKAQNQHFAMRISKYDIVILEKFLSQTKKK